MTPFSLPAEGLPVQSTVMTSHSSMLSLSLSSIEESILLDFHPLLHPASFRIYKTFLGACLWFSPSPLLRTKSFRSSLGMTDWQINAVYFIDLINGHSRGQKVCQSRCSLPYPPSPFSSNQARPMQCSCAALLITYGIKIITSFQCQVYLAVRLQANWGH